MRVSGIIKRICMCVRGHFGDGKRVGLTTPFAPSVFASGDMLKEFKIEAVGSNWAETRPLLSGRLKVGEPSPPPYVVPTTEKNHA